METILTSTSGGPHSKKGSVVYKAKLMDTTPNNAGFRIRTEVQANRNAGMGPRVLWNGPKAS